MYPYTPMYPYTSCFKKTSHFHVPLYTLFQKKNWPYSCTPIHRVSKILAIFMFSIYTSLLKSAAGTFLAKVIYKMSLIPLIVDCRLQMLKFNSFGNILKCYNTCDIQYQNLNSIFYFLNFFFCKRCNPTLMTL